MRDKNGRFVKDKNLDGRICYACGSNRTRINRKGNPDWTTNKPTDLFLCHNCMHKYIVSPKWQPIYGRKYAQLYKPRRFSFKRRSIIMKDRIQKDECKKCHKKIGDKFINRLGKETVLKKMDIHHIEYFIIFPWFATIVLCPHCHGQDSIMHRSDWPNLNSIR